MGDKKRKRDAAEDENVSQPFQKIQITADGDAGADVDSKPDKKRAKASSEARQKRSERKKKRETKSRDNVAAKQRAKSNGEDSLAAGQDFVSLGDTTSEKIAPAVAQFRRREGRSSKGASPRSIRKQKRAAAELAAAATATTDGAGTTNEATTTTAPNETEAPADQKEGEGKPSSKPRYIVFVGNLPYDATTEQIEAHFAKLQPASVRHQTDKKTKKSKGFAFLEFTNYDRMKTCLQSYHHSVFDPHGKNNDNGTSGENSVGRKLNVELTAGGGGGKSSERKNKILEKNKKLTAERERIKLKQTKKKADLERKKILKAEKEAARGGGKRTGANAEAVAGTAEADDTRGIIHPSRMARVKA